MDRKELKMNKVYLDKNGNLFINGQEIPHVLSVKSETTFGNTRVIVELEADFKKEYQKNDSEIKIDNKTM